MKTQSILFLASTLPTKHTFSMIQFSTRCTSERIFQLEGENLDWIFTDGADEAFLFLAGLAPIEMFAQDVVVSL